MGPRCRNSDGPNSIFPVPQGTPSSATQLTRGGTTRLVNLDVGSLRVLCTCNLYRNENNGVLLGQQGDARAAEKRLPSPRIRGKKARTVAVELVVPADSLTCGGSPARSASAAPGCLGRDPPTQTRASPRRRRACPRAW